MKVKVIIFAALLAVMLPAHGHSWYPLECCSGHDCHETDEVTEMPDGTAKVKVGDDVVVVPRSLQRRQSPDEHYHVCYSKWQDSTVIRCFYQPAQA